MLKRFAHTEDVLRGKFRSARPDLREDFSAFVARLCAYFDKWCDLAGVKDFVDAVTVVGSFPGAGLIVGNVPGVLSP